MFDYYMVTNPYQNLTFFNFLWQFLKRLSFFMTGQLSFNELVTDEIQIGVLAGVAMSAALVGTFLILRRMTMLANSLSHTILMGIALAYVFAGHSDKNSLMIAPMQAMLIASLIMGFITAFLTEFLNKTGQLQEDASMGLVFTTFFALGIVLVTILTRDAHIGIEAVMGNADALALGDFYWIYIILFCNLLIYFFFSKELKLTSFDPSLALALGFSPTFFNYLLMAQVSVTSITAFRAVGVLLVLAFITGPPLIARLLTDSLFKMIIGGMSIGVACSIIGVAFTRHLLTMYGMTLSTSGVVVSTIFVGYMFVAIFAPQKGMISRMRSRVKSGTGSSHSQSMTL